MEDSISTPWHGNYMILPGGTFVECLSQCRYVNVDIAVLDDHSWPYPRHQLVFGDDLAFRCDHDTQDVECSAADSQPHPIAPQLALSKIKAERPKVTCSPIDRCRLRTIKLLNQGP
jgi:hypothetical protein